jgi:hypothetical protein
MYSSSLLLLLLLLQVKRTGDIAKDATDVGYSLSLLLLLVLLLLLQVEVYKYTGDAAKDASAGSSPAVVRACVTKLPPGYSRVEVAQMQDAIWGLDGFDT